MCMCMCMYVCMFPDVSCQSMNREFQIHILRREGYVPSVNVESHMGFACSQTCMQLPMNLRPIKSD